jgi:hypothetical protein
MPGPYRSKLNKYREEIANLRRTTPPTTYKEIAAYLQTEHQLDVAPSTIFNFIKTRDPRTQRKVFALPEANSPPAAASKSVGSKSDPLDTEVAEPKPLFSKWENR